MFEGFFSRKAVVKKEEIPPSEWLHQASEEVRFTPDNALLEQADWQIFFIHDDMKEGMRNHAKIKSFGVKLLEGTTQEGFTFYIHKFADDGSSLDIPVAVTRQTTDKIIPWADQKGAPSAHIRGDVYRIRSSHVKELDKFRENGVQFLRRRVKIRVDYRDRVAFKDRGTIVNFAKDYLNHHVSRAVVTSPIEKTEFIEAWMYVGPSEYWEEQIDAGLNFEPVKLVRDKKTKLIYYKYTE